MARISAVMHWPFASPYLQRDLFQADGQQVLERSITRRANRADSEFNVLGAILIAQNGSDFCDDNVRVSLNEYSKY